MVVAVPPGVMFYKMIQLNAMREKQHAAHIGMPQHEALKQEKNNQYHVLIEVAHYILLFILFIEVLSFAVLLCSL